MIKQIPRLLQGRTGDSCFFLCLFFRPLAFCLFVFFACLIMLDQYYFLLLFALFLNCTFVFFCLCFSWQETGPGRLFCAEVPHNQLLRMLQSATLATRQGQGHPSWSGANRFALWIWNVGSLQEIPQTGVKVSSGQEVEDKLHENMISYGC